MSYAVSKYQDSYTFKEEKKSTAQRDRLFFFDTENEAKAFIQNRAFRGVQECEKALKTAQARLAKCRRKFQINTSNGEPGEEEPK